MSGVTVWISTFFRANDDAHRALLGEESPTSDDADIADERTPTSKGAVAAPSLLRGGGEVDTYKILARP